jgi:hypothetical protein
VIWQEWLEIAAELRARWPAATFPKASVLVYFKDLEDLDAVHVRAAIAAHDRAGDRFPPTAGQIRSRVIELTRDDPEWTDALGGLRRLVGAGWGGPYHAISESTARGTGAWRPILDALPDAVRAFAAACGSSQVYLAMNEEGGGEARLRDKWKAFVGQAKRDAGLVGLEAPGLSALERINREPRQIGRAALALIGDPGDIAA